MTCKHSENCSYYRTYRFKTSSRQHQFLAESYCEGNLHQNCRRMQYEVEYRKEPPEDLAPNGYLIGTHKKLRIENTRIHERHKVNNCVCLLQVVSTERTFSAWMVDISEGGVQLEINANPEDLNICTKTNQLKILGISTEKLPVPLTNETLKVAWQNNQVFGCEFIAA